jgi:DNA-binding NarL/FixJ family response regulator
MKGCKVLIVDDRTQAREGLKALLATAPAVQVAGEAADGREAMHLIEKQRPDVVLMDASMPVMDGLEATRLVKAQWPEVRVIVLTLHAALRAEALAAGADAFLVKGCPAGDLLAAILEH